MPYRHAYLEADPDPFPTCRLCRKPIYSDDPSVPVWVQVWCHKLIHHGKQFAEQS